MAHDRAKLPAGPPAKAGAKPSAAPSAAVLRLQQGAGNRAVAMLARTKQERPEGTHADLPGVGFVPLETVRFRAPGKSEKSEPDAQANEVELTSQTGDHTDKLARLGMQGATLPRAEIVFTRSAEDGSSRTVNSATLHLKDAKFTHFKFAHESPLLGHWQPVEHWTLKARSVRLIRSQSE